MSSSNNRNQTSSFEVHVAKEDFKFNAAHFVAYSGFREFLHGHNYRLGVRLCGSRKLSHDGYVVDFGNIKKSARRICKMLNEHLLCPMFSDVLKIHTDQTTVKIDCEDGTSFSFPRNDVVMLPIVHSTAEELAVYLSGKLLADLGASYLLERGVETMEVTCSEAPGQEARFRVRIPDVIHDTDGAFDLHHYLMDNAPPPTRIITGTHLLGTSETVDVSEDNEINAEWENMWKLKLGRRMNGTNGSSNPINNHNEHHSINGNASPS